MAGFMLDTDTVSFALRGQGQVASRLLDHRPSDICTRISDFAVVPYRQDQSPRLDFWGSDARNLTTEGDTRWVNYNMSHFSSRSTAS